MSLSNWREKIGRHMLQLDFRPYGDNPFRAEIDPVFDAAGVRVVHTSTSPGTTFRDLSMIHVEAPSRDLMIAKRPIVIAQDGRELALRAGDATFLRSWQAASSASVLDSSYTVIVLPLSTNSDLEASEIKGDGIVRRSDPALQLLRSHLRVLENKQHRRLDPELGAVTRRGLVDLASLLFRARERETTALSVRRALMTAAIDYAERNFRQPRLSSGNVARELGISVRYVNRLFEASGRSLADRVLELRLAAACEMLARGDRGTRISEIAMQCGFTDISAFNRRFRARYGVAPGQLRGSEC